ncbi:MAG: tetratricopeptide repeat protein, partial [Dehalococcoidia bacterium]|nr:tetratricopeptide repeat protein [Dehalococcoidia bacterium]
METNNKGNGSPVPNNLPPRPRPFVNREEELRQAIGALLDSQVPVVVLVGFAGIGKTSLALEIAHRLLDMGEFAGGIIWLPAHNLQRIDDLTDTIGTALRVPIAEVRSRLNSQRCLVILDGLDELSHQHELGVVHFLETLPIPSKALVTSRKRLEISSPATVIQVATLDEQTAIEIFTAIGGQQDREISDIDRQMATEVVRALGYHPLALTLAARLVKGNYAEARKLLKQTHETLGGFGNERERAALLHTIASVSQAQGDYSQAFQLYQQSLEIAEQIGDLQGKSATLNNLAQIYFTRGDLDSALRHFQESLALKEQLGDVYGKATTLNNLAQVYFTRGDLDGALRLYQESLALTEQLGDLAGKSATLNNLAQIYSTRG